MMVYHCKICSTDKPAEEMYRKKYFKKLGFCQSLCADCNKARRKTWDKIYYKKNAAFLNEQSKQWGKDNPEKKKEGAARWYAANKEKIRKYSSDRSKQVRDLGLHCEKCVLPIDKTLNKWWCKRHYLWHRSYNALGTTKHWETIEDMFYQQQRMCFYCKDRLQGMSHGELEHMFPRKRFPELESSVDNLVWACKPCNDQKHNRTVEEYNDYKKRMKEQEQQ